MRKIRNKKFSAIAVSTETDQFISSVDGTQKDSDKNI